MWTEHSEAIKTFPRFVQVAVTNSENVRGLVGVRGYTGDAYSPIGEGKRKNGISGRYVGIRCIVGS